MASNGNRFEGAYNKIDALLRKKIGGPKTLSFSSVVTEAARKDATVYRNKEDLLEYGDLRNAIVHDRGKTPVLLADPREDVVVKIEKTLQPPFAAEIIALDCTVWFHFGSSARVTVLAESLSYMRENDFSQVIALRDGQAFGHVHRGHLSLARGQVERGHHRAFGSTAYRRSQASSPRIVASILRPTTLSIGRTRSSQMTSVRGYSVRW